MPYHSFSVTKTARYFTAGPAMEAKRADCPAWIRPIAGVLHAALATGGYRMGHCRTGGTARYYLEGAHGRVGASWMTKEAREDDIVDYVRYLDALSAELRLTERRPVLLGFSQGVATASRWVAMGQTAFSRLILWSGVFRLITRGNRGPNP